MFKNWLKIGGILVFLALVNLGCSTNNGGGGFLTDNSNSNTNTNFVLLDANGDPIPNATLYFPSSNNLTLTSRIKSSVLGLIDPSTGAECDDPIEDFEPPAYCSGDDGDTSLNCSDLLYSVQVDGELVGQLTFPCDGSIGETVTVPGTFLDPRLIVSTLDSIVVANTSDQSIVTTFDPAEEFPSGTGIFGDVHALPNGGFAATAILDSLFAVNQFGTDGPGGTILPILGEMLVVNAALDTMSHFPMDPGYLPVDLVVTPGGLQAFVNYLNLNALLSGQTLNVLNGLPGPNEHLSGVLVFSLTSNSFTNDIQSDSDELWLRLNTNSDGSLVVVTGVNDLVIPTLTAVDGVTDGELVIIDTATLAIENQINFGGFLGGPVEIADGFAYVTPGLLGSLLGPVFPLSLAAIGPTCDTRVAVVELETETVDFLDFSNNNFPEDQCALGMSVSLDESEVYIGSAPDFLISPLTNGGTDSTSTWVTAVSETTILDQFNVYVTDLVVPFGLRTAPDGLIYIAASQTMAGSFIVILDPVTGLLTGDSIPLVSVLPLPIFLMDIQGGN